MFFVFGKLCNLNWSGEVLEFDDIFFEGTHELGMGVKLYFFGRLRVRVFIEAVFFIAGFNMRRDGKAGFL